ncbi:MAG: hypothetical protein IJ658_03070, partial [Kiritimatiellae bacterium]|nr:hypothetical protein [Kiritimatiellia bacterium]
MGAREHGIGRRNAIASRLVASATLLAVPCYAICAPGLVIVSPPDLRAAWETYAERRHAARPDLDVAVTGTDAIYAAHPFGPDLPCRNAAESVHAYIREAAQAGATHFLLGGMWLDARGWQTNELYFATGERLSLSNCVPGICARPYTGNKGCDIPSDMFYACLDDVANGSAYPWDPSGDEIYLAEDEFLSCDCVPDVAVGRFAAVPYAYGGTAAPSPSELVLAYADKVARGTAPSFPGLYRVGVASAEMVRAYPTDSRDLGRPGRETCFYDDVPNTWSPSRPAPVADAECAVREMFRTLVAPNWPVQEVEALHGTGPVFAARYASLPSAVAGFFANDMLYATCRSHGTATATSGTGITRTLYAKATGLTLFGEFCVPCLAGSVDVVRREGGRDIVMPSMGMAATCSPVGGCMAGVFNSRYGWTSEFNSINVSDGVSGSLAQLLARRLFACGDATFGLAHLRARQDFVAEYALAGTRVYALCEQMFYGDPSLGFPAVEKTRSWAGDACVTADVSAVTAHFGSDAAVAGTGRLKVMDGLSCGGTNLSLAVGGGAGGAVAFSGAAPGTLTLSGPSFYLGGTSNCTSVAVLGGGKVIDVARRDGALEALTVDGCGTANATNVLRCPASGALASLGAIPVRSAALVLETAEAFGAGDVPLAAVTNGALRLSPSPMRAWPEGTEHLARPVLLSGASLTVDAEASVFFGMRDSAGLHPFRLCVDGSCALAPSAPGGASAGLVGTTTIELEEGAYLAMGLRLYDADAGGLVLAGGGRARASADALAGSVEVREGMVLELEDTPLPAVTALVARAGSTLRIPSDPTGLHAVLAGTGRLVVEDGAVVEDLGGNVLTGRAMNGMFFEPGAALCWRGGTGAWSGAEAWYDVVTGVACPWANGRIAVFASAAAVTNDCTGVETKGFVFGADVSVSGEGMSLGTGFLEVPSSLTVTIAAPLECAGDVTKAGEGTLVLRGMQAMSGGLAARAGTLELDGVAARSATNLVAAAGASLALRGNSVLQVSSACSTIAAGTLRLASESPAALEVGRFLPSSQFAIPAGMTLRAACGYGFWRMTVNGRLDCLSPPAMAITSWIDGTGTVRTAGLWTDTTAYARFSLCRVEMAPGAFQVLGEPGTGIMRRQPKNFLFDGVTFAPVGGDVRVTNSDLPEGLVTMCVNTNGLVFDTFDAAAGTGRTVFFDDPCATNLYFYGPGDVTKVGAGAVRFTANEDLHEGRTFVHGGTYAVSTWSLSSGFHVTGEGASVEFAGEFYEGDVSVGPGSVLDLSDPAVTTVATTNLQLAAGAVLKVCVTPDGCDLL